MTIKEVIEIIDSAKANATVSYRGMEHYHLTIDASAAVIAKAVASFNRKHAKDSYSAYYDKKKGEVIVSDYSY